MKASHAGTWYRKVGEALALIEPPPPQRTEEQIRAGERAIAVMETFQREMRKKGVTCKEVQGWVREGRAV